MEEMEENNESIFMFPYQKSQTKKSYLRIEAYFIPPGSVSVPLFAQMQTEAWREQKRGEVPANNKPMLQWRRQISKKLW